MGRAEGRAIEDGEDEEAEEAIDLEIGKAMWGAE